MIKPGTVCGNFMLFYIASSCNEFHSECLVI